MDVQVVSTRTDSTVATVTDVPGKRPVRIERLAERQPYLVKVFPMRHRPVAQFAFAGTDDSPADVQLYTPIHPERVRAVTFPAYESLRPN